MFTGINSPLHKIEQGVLQDVLETLLFDLGDMHKQNLKMEEDIKFEIGLSVKQILEKKFKYSEYDID
jgi:hypothetical protein